MAEKTSNGLSCPLYGRKKIYTSVRQITAENVMRVLRDSLIIHSKNSSEIRYLRDYRVGKHPILQRTKEIRDDICNRRAVNHANEVVVYKNGAFLQRPIVYVSLTGKEDDVGKVKKLNDYLRTSGKPAADNATVNNFHTCGKGILLIEPNRKDDPHKPVNVYALDPVTSFCVYSTSPAHETMLGVNIAVTDNQKIIIDAFTDREVFRIDAGGAMGTETPLIIAPNKIISVESNTVGYVPMVEYWFDENGCGAFELAIPIFDMEDSVINNRIDGIEQFIQSMAVAINIDFDENEDGNSIKRKGLLCFKSNNENKADFKILSEQLDQMQTQNLLDDLNERWHTICGVPFMTNTDSGTSDNVGAVFMRNGYSISDTHVRNTRDLYEASNERFTEIFLSILRRKVGLDVDSADIGIFFKQGELMNAQSKAQVALSLKEFGFSPEICAERSGISDDPVSDVIASGHYIKDAWATPVAESMVNDVEKYKAVAGNG